MKRTKILDDIKGLWKEDKKGFFFLFSIVVIITLLIGYEIVAELLKFCVLLKLAIKL